MIAHAGGWDEVLLFLSVPALWVLVLWIKGKLARRRDPGR